MKRFLTLSVLLICLTMISCNPTISESEEASSAPETAETSVIAETTGEEATHILVDWSDFIRVNGIGYDGGWENREVDESCIGEKLGEILYTVKSYYESEEELNQADKRDFTAAFRPIGSEIFAVKDDENSIAVLDGGKYYLYSQRSFVNFYAYGRDSITDILNIDNLVIDSYSQLCDAFGNEQNVPEEMKTRYKGRTLDGITLIVVNLEANNGGIEYGISSVSKIGSDIYVEAVEFEAEHGDEAIHIWTFCIEIDKTVVKNVKVNITCCSPLKNDTELNAMTYEQINRYILYAPGEDLGLYEGTPATNKYAAEEIARSLGEYSGYGAFIRYCPTNNYWLVNLTRSEGSSTYITDVVIRAADGRVVSQIEAIGCS